MNAYALTRAQRRQIALLTLGAVVLILAVRVFRGRPELTHMDFIAGGPGALEFCDPANPRFLSVVSRSSPVAMVLATVAPAVADRPVEAVLSLMTNTGKPIGPRELRPTGAHAMNLLIVDPELGDFQAVRPNPDARPGKWSFAFTPHRRGIYRVFADFTPSATGREMYASVDLAVDGSEHVREIQPLRATAPEIFERDGLRFTLRPSLEPIRAREPVELNFTVARLDGGSVALQPIDGAPASLVAIDQNRTGFVNLRPQPVAPGADEREARLRFKVTIPDPGRYIVWSRADAGGGEITAPFWLEVIP